MKKKSDFHTTPHIRLRLLSAALALSIALSACSGVSASSQLQDALNSAFDTYEESSDSAVSASGASSAADNSATSGNGFSPQDNSDSEQSGSTSGSFAGDAVSDGYTTVPPIDASESYGEFSGSDIPAYTGQAYAEVNGNMPFFTAEELKQASTSFEDYSDLDVLGRCGAASASISTDTMPNEERGSIGQIKPSGWHTVKYDIVDGKYLYNRCHLIGYQLSAENANPENLITGTRAFNVDGMLPFENMVADYVHETGNHVLYRVTPVFTGDNLIADGVLMEAESVEDNGADILYNVFVYNVQPGIAIDYETGDSVLAEEAGSKNTHSEAVQNSTETHEPAQNSANTANGAAVSSPVTDSASVSAPSSAGSNPATETTDYVLNTNSMKFHRPDCSSVKKISDQNREDFQGSRAELIAEGYSPCGICKP